MQVEYAEDWPTLQGFADDLTGKAPGYEATTYSCASPPAPAQPYRTFVSSDGLRSTAAIIRARTPFAAGGGPGGSWLHAHRQAGAHAH